MLYCVSAVSQFNAEQPTVCTPGGLRHGEEKPIYSVYSVKEQSVPDPEILAVPRGIHELLILRESRTSCAIIVSITRGNAMGGISVRQAGSSFFLASTTR